jgi:WhiB family redox-sensing transcriptional regulator
MINYDDWAAEGKCRGEDPSIWYLDDYKSVKGKKNAKLAKKICGSCPVRLKCLDYALTTNERYGIWGGLSPIERNGRRAGFRPMLQKSVRQLLEGAK